jgi:hypothetical protein
MGVSATNLVIHDHDAGATDTEDTNLVPGGIPADGRISGDPPFVNYRDVVAAGEAARVLCEPGKLANCDGTACFLCRCKSRLANIEDPEQAPEGGRIEQRLKWLDGVCFQIVEAAQDEGVTDGVENCGVNLNTIRGCLTAT